MNSPTSASVEAEKGNPISESSRKSKDRMSEEGKKRKKSSGANAQNGTDTRGKSDSPAAEESEATEGTSSSAQPPKKKHSLKPRMEREAELLNPIKALQGQVGVLKHDLSKAKRIPQKAVLAHVESSPSNEVDADPGAFDNNVDPEDGESSTVTSRHGQTAPTTPNTSVMGIGNDRPINIHFNQNRRGSLEKAQFSSEQMQAFINELDGAYRSNRFVVSDTVLSLTAKASRDMITLDMLTQRLVTTDRKEDWQSWDAKRLMITALKRL